MNWAMESPFISKTASFTRRAAFVAGTAALGLLASACSSGDETTRSEDGEIVESGELSAFSINVGDCIVGAATGEVSGFEGVPCNEPHDNEVYYTFDLPDGDFPGDAVIEAEATDQCLTQFELYVGTEYEVSSYGLTWLSPTVGSWDQGDQEIACLVNNFDGTQKSGSAKGTGL